MKITARQCRNARGLLKWNPHDLASRTKIYAKRIESFERMVVHLQKWENDELVKVFTKAGIEFLEDFQVALNDKGSKTDSTHSLPGTGDSQTITLTSKDLENTTDKPEDSDLPEDKAKARKKQPLSLKKA